MLICARLSIWNTPTVSARQIMSKVAGSSAGMSCIWNNWPRCWLIRARQRRMALSMPSASTSTFSRPMASRSSLSHWMMERSGMAAFSTGTSRVKGPRVSTKPPGCWLKWRGKPCNCWLRSSHCCSVTSSGNSASPTRANAAANRSASTTRLCMPGCSRDMAVINSSGMPNARPTSRKALRGR